METSFKKKEWFRPKLAILTRDDEQVVLGVCKRGDDMNSYPHGPGVGGCRIAVGWATCEARDCCGGDYSIVDYPCTAGDRTRGVQYCFCSCYTAAAS